MPPAGLNPIAFQNRTGHNAAGSEVFYYFLSLWKESNPRKHTEGTEVPSGSLLGALKVSFGNTRIGLKITASATILPAPGAPRGVGYDSDTLRQQGAIGGKEISN